MLLEIHKNFEKPQETVKYIESIYCNLCFIFLWLIFFKEFVLCNCQTVTFRFPL